LAALHTARSTTARSHARGIGDAPNARDVSIAGLWRTGAPMTLYVSDQAHHSLTKAADIVGLGREQVRVIETDQQFRMDVRLLRERIETDLQAGLLPFCITATAGTVNTRAIDPLAEIADVAETLQLCLPVDDSRC